MDPGEVSFLDARECTVAQMSVVHCEFSVSMHAHTQRSASGMRPRMCVRGGVLSVLVCYLRAGG